MSRTNFAKDQLKSIVERIERLEEEKRLSDAQIDTMHAVENADSVVKVCRSVEDVAAVLAQFRIPTRGRIAA